MKALRNVGEGLTREKLLDLLAKAPNDTQLGVIVSYTRPGIDYEFFQLLSDRIEHAKGDKREKLLKLRERLLELTREIDRAVEARVTQSREFLREILKTNNIVETVQQNLPAIDDFFEQAFNEEMEAARKSADLGKISKLQQIEEALKKANTPPPELKVIQELLESADEKQMLANLQAHQEEVNQLFLDLLSSLMSQIGPEEDPQVVKRIQTLYQAALRISMQKNLGK